MSPGRRGRFASRKTKTVEGAQISLPSSSPYLELAQRHVHKLLVQHGLRGEVGGGRADERGLWEERGTKGEGRSLRGCCPRAVAACAPPLPAAFPPPTPACHSMPQSGGQCTHARGRRQPPHTHNKKLTAFAATRRAAGAARRADATRATRAGAREARAATEKAMVGGGEWGKEDGKNKKEELFGGRAVAFFVGSSFSRSLFRPRGEQAAGAVRVRQRQLHTDRVPTF